MSYGVFYENKGSAWVSEGLKESQSSWTLFNVTCYVDNDNTTREEIYTDIIANTSESGTLYILEPVTPVPSIYHLG